MYQHIEKSNSYESISLNKTIDLEEMQKEVDKIKNKIKQARLNIVEVNKASNETLHAINREATDNFIKHHSLNNRNKNYFDHKDSIPASFKIKNKKETKIPEFIKHELEDQSE